MKTYTNNIRIIFILCSFFYFLFSSAQAPNKMSYQAVVRNTAGVLVANTNVGIQISILQTTATGTPVYIERHTTPTNANGLATLEIGGGTLVAGNFTTINWANGPYFIKTETDPTGGTTYSIFGTSQMLSVPYALFAGASANNWGLNGNLATATNFIGTTNDSDIIFKRNGTQAGRIETFNTSYGFESLLNNNGGFFNTAIGNQALKSNTTGIGNVAIGDFALLDNIIGSENTATGVGSLSRNTSGTNNTANGRSALGSNTTGSFNTANGSRALFNNITGESNVAIGLESLRQNTTGSNNTAIGVESLRNNSTGTSNAAIGFESLKNNTTGFNNSAHGLQALTANTTGNNNIAMGFQALFANTTGDNNTAIGVLALDSNTLGNNNSAVGRNALNNNTTGINNTAMGFGSLDTNTTGENNTANGVGSLSNNLIGNSNTAIGRDALFNSTGSNNTALGRGTLSGVTTGINNTAIGFDAQVAVQTNNNQVRIGNTAVTLASVQVAFTTTSDNRWKSNIQKSNLGLEFIKQLNPVFYTRKDVETNEGKTNILETTTNPTTEYGFIAQELESTLNNFNAKDNGIISKDDAGMLGVRYNDLLAPMVKAIQEQQIIIEELKAKIILLEKRK